MNGNSYLQRINSYKITKGLLEKEAPDFLWTAKRHNFGWKYIGKKGDIEVTVQAFAEFCGFVEDDCVITWRVLSNNRSQSYVSWLLEERNNV